MITIASSAVAVAASNAAAAPAPPPLPAGEVSCKRSEHDGGGIRRVLAFTPAFARLILGLTLLAAAGAKLANLDIANGELTHGIRLFAATIAAHHVLPATLALPTAWAVIITETVLGLWLLSHRRERAAAASAIALLLAFSLHLIAARIKSGNATCGCFGRVTTVDLSFSLARNTSLMLAACLTFVRQLRAPPPVPPGEVAESSRPEGVS